MQLNPLSYGGPHSIEIVSIRKHPLTYNETLLVDAKSRIAQSHTYLYDPILPYTYLSYLSDPTYCKLLFCYR